MAYTLGQAAKATGKSKATISNAIGKGWISAAKNDQGQWQIEPAELNRVYRLKNEKSNESNPAFEPTVMMENERLKATVEGLERLCRQITDERDRLSDQNTRLTALISAPPPQTAKRIWWKFGRAT